MNRFNGSAPHVTPYDIDDLELYTWFERDRQHVELRDEVIDTTIVEFWDEAVSELVEDGFLDPSSWKKSLFDYAIYMGIINE